MPFSASMFYGASSPPGNQSSTPQVYDVLFQNLSLHLPTAAEESEYEAGSGVSFQFLGLPESLMRDFRFENIHVANGQSHGWECQNVSEFTFSDVTPAPTAKSGCL